MKTIPLANTGKVALVSDRDYATVSEFRWRIYHVKDREYAITGKRPVRKMHRMILPQHARIDHRDRNGLNNCRRNIRGCNQSQNVANSRKRHGGTSKYKGVYYNAELSKWTAEIMKNYRHYYLGVFTLEKEAARAYNRAAKKFFGRFARINKL